MAKSCTAVAKTLAVALLMAGAGSVAAQQNYPSKAIRFIVPYPGGGSDVLARFVAQKLTESLGQQVFVDNRPGGNTIIGSEALVKSPADGYTILLATSTHVINPSLLSTPYDAIKDFAPVATIGSSELILVVHPSIPASTLQEFIALAKSRPGQINYASSGNGTTNHLTAELFSIMTGTRMEHIPYKGTAQALTDLISGQVQLSFAASSSFSYIKSGKLKAIAISGETRALALPQVPTFAESGLPNFEVKYWYGVLAPAGTPRAVIDRLSAEIARMLAVPEIREKLLAQGLDPFVSTPEQFAALIKAGLARYAKVIKTANIRL